MRGDEARKGEPNAHAIKDGDNALLAQLDEKDRQDSRGMKVQTDAGTPAPSEQPMDLLVAGSKEGDSNFPGNPNVKLVTPEEKNSYYTWRDTAALQAKDGAGLPPVVTQRDSLDPNDQPQSTAIGLGPTAHRALKQESVAAAKPAGRASGALQSQASKGTYNSLGPGDPFTAPSQKSREELGVAYGGKRGSRLDDSRAQLEGKAKADESAKKLAKQEQDFTKHLGDLEEQDTFSPGQAPAKAPADEAQVRLRQLLERADSAEVERLARLRGAQMQVNGGLHDFGYISGEDRDNELSLRQLYFQLTPEQRAQLLDQECRRVFDGCRRRPDERPRDMFFRYWGDNPFEITALDSLSTFSVDVDTASYALARRYLVEDKLPEKAQIRTEEFVNYFKADVAAPTHGTFAIHTDLAPSRFAQPANSTWTLRVVVRGKELAKEERKPLHLTCVIDCSGSMREQNRMETVKDTLRLLLTQLKGGDMVGLVAFRIAG